MAMLEIRNIFKQYERGIPVLNGVNMDVNAGEIFFLLGPSGCGKSTLLRILAGFVQPDSGSICLNGRDITFMPPEKRNTPMMFQSYALWPHMNVFENVAFGLQLRKLPKAEITAEVNSLLETVGMTEYRNRRIPELSGGQQQRVALARALAMKAPILLLDEPLSNLDAKLRDRMRVEIRRICKQRGLTAIYVTHDRREALSVGDRIAVLHKGVLQQAGTPRELYLHPVNRFTASFLGEANFISAEYQGKDSVHYRFKTAIGELLVHMKNQRIVPVTGKPYWLTARPEALAFDVPDTVPNRFQATITENTYLGESTARLLDANGLELHANEFCSPERAEGESVTCAIPPEHVMLLEE